VTRLALVAGNAAIVGPSHDRRIVELAAALMRRVAVRMTVDAARMHQHARRLGEQRARSIGAIADHQEVIDRAQLRGRYIT
jgi:hypothetical protein